MKYGRLFDAECNRIREAYRTLEDVYRFIYDDQYLTKELKKQRHHFLSIEKKIFASVTRSRQSQSDVGRTLKNPTSSKRFNYEDVCAAAWSRLQETLRSLSENLKVEKPPLADAVESLRYISYDLQTLATRKRAWQWPLYVLISSQLSHHHLETLVPQLIQAKVGAIQLREKNISDKQILAKARKLKKLVGHAPVQLILNDRADLAVLAGFDGVHVGQSDISPAQIKKIFGPRLFVGLSTHSVKQAAIATKQGADYIGIGPIFKTQTKAHLKFIGLQVAKKMIQTSQNLPHVCIGGIDESNIKKIFNIGAQGVALCTGIIQAKKPATTAKKITKLMTRA